MAKVLISLNANRWGCESVTIGKRRTEQSRWTWLCSLMFDFDWYLQHTHTHTRFKQIWPIYLFDFMPKHFHWIFTLQKFKENSVARHFAEQTIHRTYKFRKIKICRKKKFFLFFFFFHFKFCFRRIVAFGELSWNWKIGKFRNLKLKYISLGRMSLEPKEAIGRIFRKTNKIIWVAGPN